MFCRVLLVGALVPVLMFAGALGAPFLRDEVPFEAVEREHFDALAVRPLRDAPEPDAPLLVRVHRMGDGADADLGKPFAWLRQHANVMIVDDPAGAPLFLTRGDLAATSGRGTLGATLPTGMAVEVSDQGVADCVVAHELLHFLGLGHVDDPDNIMYRHCYRGMLDRVDLEPWQKTKLDSLRSLHATTPRGVLVWASRAG